MWWLLIPIGGAIAKVVYNAITEEDEVPVRKSTLERNIERQRIDEQNFRNVQLVKDRFGQVKSKEE